MNWILSANRVNRIYITLPNYEFANWWSGCDIYYSPMKGKQFQSICMDSDTVFWAYMMSILGGFMLFIYIYMRIHRIILYMHIELSRITQLPRKSKLSWDHQADGFIGEAGSKLNLRKSLGSHHVQYSYAILGITFWRIQKWFLCTRCAPS